MKNFFWSLTAKPFVTHFHVMPVPLYQENEWKSRWRVSERKKKRGTKARQGVLPLPYFWLLVNKFHSPQPTKFIKSLKRPQKWHHKMYWSKKYLYLSHRGFKPPWLQIFWKFQFQFKLALTISKSIFSFWVGMDIDFLELQNVQSVAGETNDKWNHKRISL